uniref:C3H1-type domain-containing protein n=1 Tax=Ananas comosus var. bracteatus TaxID=296719 RepID=A0A6V7QH26_ANACO|nr:unnamed protein product [Ananas comosus var. bracteatus]
MAPQSPNSPSSPRSPRKRSRSSSPSSSPWSYDDYIDGYASAAAAAAAAKENGGATTSPSWYARTSSAALVVELPSIASSPTPTPPDKVTACADSLRNKCFRGSTCRYYHPPPHIQKSLLKSIGLEDPKPRSPRKRRRSSSPRSSPWSYNSDDDGYGNGSAKRRRNNLSVEVCKDFIRHICRRPPIDCKFAHPLPAVTIEGDKVTACADSLRNKCFRGLTCRYYHPPPHIQKSLQESIGIEDAKMETVSFASVCQFVESGYAILFVCGELVGFIENIVSDGDDVMDDHGYFTAQVCLDYMRGKCFRSARECRFSHQLSSGNSEIVCQDFLHGRCERKSCRYSHVPAHSMPQAYLLPRGAPMNVPNSPPRIANDQDVLPVCKDFLKNMCRRESCKYAHPDSQTEVIGDQVEVCRDFRRGLCHRSVCRFYHPSTALSAAKVNRVETHPLF